MLLTPSQLVQQIHDAPTQIVLVATGGGSRAIADLLEVPGASRTLLEAIVPYSTVAMIDWLGGNPDDFCSAATARAMAMAAFERSRWLAVEATEVECLAGIACTASLASDRPKRGAHRVHLAVQTHARTVVWSLQLLKERRSRAEEERLVGRLLLNIMADACDIPEQLALELLEGEHVEESQIMAPVEWRELLLGQRDALILPSGAETPKIVFPGAFNPLHRAHRRMAELAEGICGGSVAWEISILNVDKPPIDYIAIRERLGQFSPQQTVCLTRAATFEEKSRLFPGATFIVGADTMHRILNPHYYDDNPAACLASLERIAARGCRFLVFGRDSGEGFLRLGELKLPESLQRICQEVSVDVFCDDISSSSIRTDTK